MTLSTRVSLMGLFVAPLLWLALSAADPPPAGGLITSTTSPFAAPTDPNLRKLIENYRAEWPRLTGLQYSGMHWGQSVIVFVNQHRDIYRRNHRTYLLEFEEADEDETYEYTPYPVGTIFVKENFLLHIDQKAQALTLAIMIKHKPGYDPELGDWEFIQVGADGQTIVQGASSKNPAVASLCGDCHKNLADRDYIFHTAGP